MATGSGKSICYQMPPLLLSKTAVVISPLLSLMQDQVMGLKQKGIRSDYMGSTQSNTSVTRDAENGKFQVLYMTPEKAMSLPTRFWDNIRSKGVCLLAVDEAHCISEWGHDFRVEYKKLHLLRNMLPGVPFVALTATATERVRADIIESLKLLDPHIHIGSFDRPNLFYGAKCCERSVDFINQLKQDVTKSCESSESTIVYCATVRDAEKIHSVLTSHGIKTGLYHGQLGKKDREESHKLFITDELKVMVATMAFGMGIDKPDVRCVMHYGCPKSLESYYQESGRCGRDGLPSVCWLYYRRCDFNRGEFHCSEAKSIAQKTSIMESFLAGKNYCLLGTCRRQSLLMYFGENIDPQCGNCDNCTTAIKVQKDLSKETSSLLSVINQMGGRFGLNLPIDVIRGSRGKKVTENLYDQLPEYGSGRRHSNNWWKALGTILLNNGKHLSFISSGLNLMTGLPKIFTAW
ncbi:hypothetical protein HU200_012513 [Digitaria exilis]|uniref:ATP-dependent DNA helicase n=1 Tax=Digitaria exilis TaxID=1010633 RepID=A0A835FEX0_9POAL|nr:hypothetical protein HU200_012513 [Digitaria exilis]